MSIEVVNIGKMFDGETHGEAPQPGPAKDDQVPDLKNDAADIVMDTRELAFEHGDEEDFDLSMEDLINEQPVVALSMDDPAQNISMEIDDNQIALDANMDIGGVLDSVTIAGAVQAEDGDGDDVLGESNQDAATKARPMQKQNLNAEEQVFGSGSPGGSEDEWEYGSSAGSVDSEYEDYRFLLNHWDNDLASQGSDGSASNLSDFSNLSEGEAEREEQTLTALLQELSSMTGGKKKGFPKSA